MYARSIQPPDTSFFLFGNQLRTLDAGDWVVVDEVQRLPNLLNEVHRGIEEFGLRFALTGSSARKLKRAGVNLLAGRARLRSMLPLLPNELRTDFDLDHVLRWGSVPLIWNAKDKDGVLQDYVQTYVKQEIQAEDLVRHLAGFARSLPVMALFNAQVINVAAMAGDAEVERKTAEGYLAILEDTLLMKRLFPYQAKITVRETRNPKMYFTGLPPKDTSKLIFLSKKTRTLLRSRPRQQKGSDSSISKDCKP